MYIKKLIFPLLLIGVLVLSAHPLHAGKLKKTGPPETVDYSKEIDGTLETISADFKVLNSILYLPPDAAFIKTSYSGLPFWFWQKGNNKAVSTAIDNINECNIRKSRSVGGVTLTDIDRRSRRGFSKKNGLSFGVSARNLYYFNQTASKIRGRNSVLVLNFTSTAGGRLEIGRVSSKTKVLGLSLSGFPLENVKRILENVFQKQKAIMNAINQEKKNVWIPAIWADVKSPYLLHKAAKNVSGGSSHFSNLSDKAFSRLTIYNGSFKVPKSELKKPPWEIHIHRSPFVVKDYDQRYNFKKILESKVADGSATVEVVDSFTAYKDVKSDAAILFDLESGNGIWQGPFWARRNEIEQIFKRINKNIEVLGNMLGGYNKSNIEAGLKRLREKNANTKISF